MPTLTTTPVALPQNKELEASDQEFELDIRISMVEMAHPTLSTSQVNTCVSNNTCETQYTCDCATETCSGGTCDTCNRPYC